MQNNTFFLLLVFIMPVCLLVPSCAFGQEVAGVRAIAEQCGRDYFDVVYTAFIKDAKCRKNPYRGMCSDGISLTLTALSHGKSLVAQCEQKVDDFYKPWLVYVLDCEVEKIIFQEMQRKPKNTALLEFSRIMSVAKHECDPISSPEEMFKENEINKAAHTEPKLVSPLDGAKIVWGAMKGTGLGTIHLGISVSDHSFWRYVYGSDIGAQPVVSLDEIKELNNAMKQWEELGLTVRDFAR